MTKKHQWTDWIDRALDEDIGQGDITTDLLIPADQFSQGAVLLKEKAVLCGLEIARETFQRVDPKLSFRPLFKEGEMVPAGRVAEIKGRTRGLLSAERVALNFLGYLSAIATKTRAFTEAIKPHRCEILDTRKTTPGLRSLERYAVRCGGGVNHRDALDSMILIKDNHWAALSGQPLVQMIRDLRKQTKKKIAVEVDRLDQFQAILNADPDIILLDNMSISQLQKAVQIYQKFPSRKKPQLEVSGGIGLHNVKKVAATGVQRISIGELTHSRRAVDFSLEIFHS